MATSTGMSAILLMCISLLKSGDHVVCSQSMFGSTIKLIRQRVREVWCGIHFGVADRCGCVEGRRAPQHQTAVCRDTDQSADRGVRHHGAGRHCAQCGRASGRGQLLCHAGAAAAGAAWVPISSSTLAPSTWMVRAVSWPVPSAAPAEARCVMKFLPVHTHGWHGAGALQCLGGAQGHGDPGPAHESAERADLGSWASGWSPSPRWHRVFYPGLPSHPQHALAMQQQAGLGGAVLSFDVKASTPEQRAHARLPCAGLHAGALAVHQSGRHQNPLHAHPASTSHGR